MKPAGARWRQPLSREGIRRDLLRRFLVRFQMSLIVGLSIGTGVIANRLLLAGGLEMMWLRYLCAMAASYLAFLLGVKLWLLYAGYAWPRASRLGLDLPDFGGGGIGGPPMPAAKLDLPAGGGGDFAGGGASGDFGGALAESAGDAAHGLGDVVAKAGGAVGDLGGSDEGGCALVVALLVIAAVLAVVFGAAVYIILDAPAILAEAVFEVLLAGGLVRASRRAEEADWMRGVLRATWKPFAAILAVVMGFAAWAALTYPQAHTVSQLLAQAALDEKK